MRGDAALEAVVLALSVPVMISVEDVAAVALASGLGLAVLCLLTAGALRRPEAYAWAVRLQVGAIALGFLTAAMFFVGAMFAGAVVAGARPRPADRGGQGAMGPRHPRELRGVPHGSDRG